jgi:L-lactate dehydrogenase complex protein LldG
MATADSGSREQILERVRRAVKQPAPRRAGNSAGPIFAPIADPLGRFQNECAANYTECILTQDVAAALRQVLNSLPEGEIFLQDAPGLRKLIDADNNDAGNNPARPLRWSSEGAPRESSQATVSLCEALVAISGSVLVSSRNCGGRGISVVAPCHIVVARRDQLVADLDAALQRARQVAPDSSYVGLITGSSRTADIEKLLVIGAHGPRRLVVIVQG